MSRPVHRILSHHCWQLTSHTDGHSPRGTDFSLEQGKHFHTTVRFDNKNVKIIRNITTHIKTICDLEVVASYVFQSHFQHLPYSTVESVPQMVQCRVVIRKRGQR